MVHKYIIDKADIHSLLTGKEIPLQQGGNKARAFCVEIASKMTNREIISEFVERDDSFAIMVDEVNGTVNIELSLDFWNAPLQDKPPCGRCRYHDDYADKSIRPTYCKTMCANNWNGFRERER